MTQLEATTTLQRISSFLMLLDMLDAMLNEDKYAANTYPEVLVKECYRPLHPATSASLEIWESGNLEI